MDFKDTIKQIAERIEKLKPNLATEEATKNALVLPMLTALGYDVFNPEEVLPEMCCDIGTKKGEKIDYAILRDGEPIILIECKHWEKELTLYDNQLLRYYHVSKARFGILTNGIIYRFYTDLAEANKMDEKPFLEVNLLNPRDAQIEELKKFHKSYFDVDNILSTASELKYMSELKNVLVKEFASPSADFVRFIGKQVYEGSFTQRVQEQFATLTKRAIISCINDTISERLNAALQSNGKEESQPSVADDEQEAPTSSRKDKIVTTEEELEAYYLIKSILRSVMPAERVTYRDAITYFSVFIDDNNRKVVCRLRLDSPTNKQISFVDDSHKETTYKLQNGIDDIYLYEEQLKVAALRWK